MENKNPVAYLCNFKFKKKMRIQMHNTIRFCINIVFKNTKRFEMGYFHKV